MLNGGPDDYRAEACYGATSGYEDLATPHLLLTHLIGVVLCYAISLQHDMRIFEVFLWGTPTIGTRHRAAFVGLVETRMTTLAWINASLLLCGLWAGLRLGGTGLRYGGCLPPTWWALYALLLFSQAAQSLVALTAMLSLRVVPPVGPSSSPAGYGVMTADARDGGTLDDGPYRRNYCDIHGNNGTHHHHHIAKEMWQARCVGCCRALAVSTCFLFGGRGIVSHAAKRGGGGGVGNAGTTVTSRAPWRTTSPTSTIPPVGGDWTWSRATWGWDSSCSVTCRRRGGQSQGGTCCRSSDTPLFCRNHSYTCSCSLQMNAW